MNKEDSELQLKCMTFFTRLAFLGDIIDAFNEHETKGWE